MQRLAEVAHRKPDDPSPGWTIGEAKEYASQEEQDATDAESSYRTLEEEISPPYYARNAKSVPEGWAGVMKEAIATVAPEFSAQRMACDYVHELYVPREAGRAF